MLGSEKKMGALKIVLTEILTLEVLDKSTFFFSMYLVGAVLPEDLFLQNIRVD